MRRTIFVIFSLLLLTISSCKRKNQETVTAIPSKTISKCQTEKTGTDSSDNTSTDLRKISNQKKPGLNRLISTLTKNSAGDSIVGFWEVENEYYMAIYEIEKYGNQYFGKVHYYNDGETEYKAQNSKDDYFLEGVTWQNGSYTAGKMHMPDASNYQVKFTLNGDELTAAMTIQGQPYQEIWKRKIYK